MGVIDDLFTQNFADKTKQILKTNELQILGKNSHGQ